ncbi:MAG: amidohydrolase family protein [Candidatus Hadarchaeum sp.]|uniref:amidohydrolase family protein n=1 Tax=Candidatus Hadarchaeum sp. TaxID=2883567 RepID=UPI003D0DDEAB
MADFIITNGFLVTMDRMNRIIDDGALVVEGNRILAVGKTAEIKRKYRAEEVIDAKGKAILPGFVTPHHHMYNSLTRYMDIPLQPEVAGDFGSLLTRWWWPKIEDTCTKEDVFVGVLLASVEMLKNGITCTADLQEGQNLLPGALEHAGRACDEAGIRAFLSFETTDRVSLSKGKMGLRENEAFIKERNYKRDARVRGMMGIHTCFSCTPETLIKAREIANRHKCGIQIHIAQSTYEVEMIKNRYHVDGSVEFLDSIGFLGPDVAAAHGIYISKKELEIWRRSNVGLSFNVKSNAFYANGLAPAVELIKRNGKVGLGIDGVNIYDMFELMTFSMALLRLYYLDGGLLPSSQALHLATMGGAKVLGSDREIGSLEPNKKADIILVDFSGKAKLTPSLNKLDILAFSCRGSDVDTVMVDGKIVVRNKRILTVDEDSLLERAQRQAEKYQERAIETPINPVWKLPRR